MSNYRILFIDGQWAVVAATAVSSTKMGVTFWSGQSIIRTVPSELVLMVEQAPPGAQSWAISDQSLLDMYEKTRRQSPGGEFPPKPSGAAQ